MKKVIEATIRLRRDNDYNYEAIKDKFVPANGEVILVDTARDGLRAKVGDGYSTYAELQFTDADLRNTVLQGYYNDGVFYSDPTMQTRMLGMINKIYIDIPRRRIYYFNGTGYELATANATVANAETAGIMKLYSTTGQNTDGTMTQKSITDELNQRIKTEVNAKEELLIFSL